MAQQAHISLTRLADGLYRHYIASGEEDGVKARLYACRDVWRLFGRLPSSVGNETYDFASVPKAFADVFALPPEEAIKHLQGMGFAVTDATIKLLPQLRSRVFTIARIMSADILSDVHEMLTQAAASGETFEEFQKGLEEKLEKRGWKSKAEPDAKAAEVVKGGAAEARKLTPSRLRLIFRNNMSSAYSARRINQMKETAKVRPIWQYIAIRDQSTTEVCNRLHGKAFPADDPIWNTHAPPNHHHCRATVRSLSERDAERYGVKVEKGSDYVKDGAQPDDTFLNNPANDPGDPDLSAYPEELQKQIRAALAKKQVA